ncbi:hypothetical protein B0A49_12397 [Cryomyces minteri]|uniref:RCHY1 zinc-ribbon domain-containing protein n=1 Tax=Cryomyces minteri TaxID=331657 RepID=A0A4U0WW66_9PEZI|nr:hypothetical protein B0A49_12397 [Cryomyces minteri]
MSGSLPEDDGMRMLRHQIHIIRQTGGSNEEMARMMHELMTKEYHASQAHILRATSPSSPSNSNLLHTPASTLSGTEAEMQSSSPSSVSSLLDPETQYNLTPQDRVPTYWPKPSRDPSTASPISSSSDEEEPSLGCAHYKRNVKIQCFDCHKCAVNMELQWRKLDQAIETQPMPEQYAETKAFVRCNDCGGKGWTRYHWLGNKCTTCDSYNTNEIKLSGPNGQIAPEPAPAVVADRQAIIGLAPNNTERVESAIDPASPPRRPVQRTTGSYFLTADDDAQRPVTAEESRPSLPYQMFQRVSRSLSPMRYYLERVDTENDAVMADVGHVEGRRKEDGNDDADDWEDDDGESEDSDESMDDEDDAGDAEEGDEEMDGMEIFGHR